MTGLIFDEIGEWSEIKLEIIKKYSVAYSKILSKREYFEHYYIDAFSGSGKHLSKRTGKIIPGSPLNALQIEPRFHGYFLIDICGDKIDSLRKYIENESSVQLFKGDCNEILLEDIFLQISYQEYKRALCLLDPYNIDLDWKVIKKAADMRTIDIFLNFPIMDMNRNAIWRKKPDEVPESQKKRMDLFWGDRTWKDIAYEKQDTLFEDMPDIVKKENKVIAEAFRCRLQNQAGFKYVPSPYAVKNTPGSILYYLFFASQNEKGAKIANDIFNRYRKRV